MENLIFCAVPLNYASNIDQIEIFWSSFLREII